jgi:hypothetical protein
MIPMADNTSFRDQLLAVEPLPPDVRHQLEKEILNMMVRKLPGPARIMVALVAVVALASAGLCAYLAMTEAKLPIVARIGLGTGTLFGLAWAAWSIKVVRKGELDMRLDSRRAAQMSWVFTVLMVVFFLFVGMSAADRLLGVLMIVQSLAFLIGAAVYWLNYRIEAAELSVKEQILRTELHIAEFFERRQDGREQQKT